MIDERTQEQAALHVLGALTEAEAREFKRNLEADPELKAYVARLSKVTGAIAGAVPAMEPPPQLRAKVLAQIASRQKIVSLPERKASPLSWLAWAFATCLAILCVVLFAQDSRLRKTIGNQTKQIDKLNQLTQSLQAATNNLEQAVMVLQETNRLANLKIAMLNSLLADAPKAVAVSLWDNQTQNGVFLAQNLKTLPADRDYQLWILDNGTTPVSAGVFHVNTDGSTRVNFKALQPIQVAGKFAVTEEPRGGQAAPTLKNLVLIGG